MLFLFCSCKYEFYYKGTPVLCVCVCRCIYQVLYICICVSMNMYVKWALCVSSLRLIAHSTPNTSPSEWLAANWWGQHKMLSSAECFHHLTPPHHTWAHGAGECVCVTFINIVLESCLVVLYVYLCMCIMGGWEFYCLNINVVFLFGGVSYFYR